MRIATWNVRCAARPRRWTAAFGEAIEAFEADVVVLTEYAPHADGCALQVRLRHAGFTATCVSARVEGQNQLLIASKGPLRQEQMTVPDLGPAVPPNFLHVTLLDHGVDLLGLRIPTDRRRKGATWDWLQGMADRLVTRPAILTGDFNTDACFPLSRCGDRLERLADCRWQWARADGDSYWTPAGIGYSIDHLFANRFLTIGAARYVTDSAGHALVARNPGRAVTQDARPRQKALSDHAALVVDIALQCDQFAARGRVSTDETPSPSLS